jgi:hypothetical protein
MSSHYHVTTGVKSPGLAYWIVGMNRSEHLLSEMMAGGSACYQDVTIRWPARY